MYTQSHIPTVVQQGLMDSLLGAAPPPPPSGFWPGTRFRIMKKTRKNQRGRKKNKKNGEVVWREESVVPPFPPPQATVPFRRCFSYLSPFSSFSPHCGARSQARYVSLFRNNFAFSGKPLIFFTRWGIFYRWWRSPSWPPSWILSRIRNQVKIVRNNFLRLTCKITQIITLHHFIHKFYIYL